MDIVFFPVRRVTMAPPGGAGYFKQTSWLLQKLRQFKRVQFFIQVCSFVFGIFLLAVVLAYVTYVCKKKCVFVCQEGSKRHLFTDLFWVRQRVREVKLYLFHFLFCLGKVCWVEKVSGFVVWIMYECRCRTNWGQYQIQVF